MFHPEEHASIVAQAGVVNCVAYRRSDGHRLGALVLADVSEALAEDSDVFVWIGLHEPSADIMAEVQHEFAAAQAQATDVDEARTQGHLCV